MKRREVMVGITALLVSPRHSRAQGKPRRIGFLGAFADEPGREPGRDTVHAAWLSGLRETGWIEGKNLLVEYRYAPDRLPALAAELIAVNTPPPKGGGFEFRLKAGFCPPFGGLRSP